MATQVKSRTGRLMVALQSGKEFTPAQIKSQFKLANPRAAVNNLRVQGHSIVTGSRTNSKGVSTTVYSAGKTSARAKARA